MARTGTKRAIAINVINENFGIDQDIIISNIMREADLSLPEARAYYKFAIDNGLAKGESLIAKKRGRPAGYSPVKKAIVEAPKPIEAPKPVIVSKPIEAPVKTDSELALIKAKNKARLKAIAERFKDNDSLKDVENIQKNEDYNITGLVEHHESFTVPRFLLKSDLDVIL